MFALYTILNATRTEKKHTHLVAVCIVPPKGKNFVLLKLVELATHTESSQQKIIYRIPCTIPQNTQNTQNVFVCICVINIYILNIHMKSSENYWVTKFNV